MDRELRKRALDLVEGFTSSRAEREEKISTALVYAILSLDDPTVSEPQELTERNPEPPIGSVVIDRDRDAWGRSEKGWSLIQKMEKHVTWREVAESYGPVGLLWEGEN